MKKDINYKNKKNDSFFQTAFLGALITLIGGFLLSYNYIQKQKIVAYDYMSNAFYDGKTVGIKTTTKNDGSEKNKIQTQTEQTSQQTDNS